MDQYVHSAFVRLGVDHLDPRAVSIHGQIDLDDPILLPCRGAPGIVHAPQASRAATVHHRRIRQFRVLFE